MAKTVVGLFETFAQAQRTVRDLVEAGIDRARIGVMSTPAGASDDASEGEATGDSLRDDPKERKAATIAAGAGAAAVGGLGLAMALAPVAIPGVGLIIAAGALVAGLTGAGIAASLPKVLRRLGVPEEQAHAYAEGVRRGGTLVTVEALDDDGMRRALAVMKKHGATDIQKRAEEWRQGGRQTQAATPTVASDAVPGGLFVFSYEEEVRVAAYPEEERRRSQQVHSGAERRKAA
jgi:hypothetical protein